MKIRTMAAAMLLIGLSQAANAGDQDFRLVNRTGFDVREVYVSPSRRSSWGNDVLGSGMLHNGNQVPIRFKPNNNVCVYDLKVVYTDDDTAEWTEFDLCTISKITISYDAKTREPTAEYE